jgi:hypothetical protein
MSADSPSTDGRASAEREPSQPTADEVGVDVDGDCESRGQREVCECCGKSRIVVSGKTGQSSSTFVCKRCSVSPEFPEAELRRDSSPHTVV